MLTALAPRPRQALARGLAAVAVLLLLGASWAYTILMPDMEQSMAEMATAAEGGRAWFGVEAFFTFAMWAVMMVAMMTPSALPMVLVFEHVQRTRRPGLFALLATGAFLSGYLVLWILFSAAATLVQAALHAAGLLSIGMQSTSPVFSGVLLLMAGLYQFSPLKNACLSKCRSPLAFVLAEWREGLSGAARMGLRHGLFCVGCCGALMALLFAGGVMNLRWIGVLAALVLIEKVWPDRRVATLIGAALLAGGAWLLLPP